MRILIVEDDLALQRQLRWAYEGYEIVVAASRGEAIEALRRRDENAPALLERVASGDLERVEALGADILRLCVEVGGCLTGEHGVGVEKREHLAARCVRAEVARRGRAEALVLLPHHAHAVGRCSTIVSGLSPIA